MGKTESDTRKMVEPGEKYSQLKGKQICRFLALPAASVLFHHEKCDIKPQVCAFDFVLERLPPALRRVMSCRALTAWR